MTYDDFSDRLRKIKAEFLAAHGRPLETISDLEDVLAKRLVKPRKKGLRSLRGIVP